MSELNPDLEHGNQATDYLKQVKNKRNGCVPKPPLPGEYLHCQHCGKVMMPEDFHPNEIIKRREFKWQLHYRCMQEIEALCDRQTTGLLSERQRRQ